MDIVEYIKPNRRLNQSNFQNIEAVTDEIREFMAPMVVLDDSHLIGKTVQVPHA